MTLDQLYRSPTSCVSRGDLELVVQLRVYFEPSLDRAEHGVDFRTQVSDVAEQLLLQRVHVSDGLA